VASQIEIINRAIILLGAEPITSLSEGTVQQVAATSQWDTTRKSLLRDHPWNFAIKQSTLSPVAGVSHVGYIHAFKIPSDSLRILTVAQNGTNVDFRNRSNYLFTNSNPVTVDYIYDEADPIYWDALFVNVFAYKLASDIGYALTKSQTSANAMYELYERALKKARYVDSSEDTLDAMNTGNSSILASRG
jgi:hypothetical protein